MKYIRLLYVVPVLAVSLALVAPVSAQTEEEDETMTTMSQQRGGAQAKDRAMEKVEKVRAEAKLLVNEERKGVKPPTNVAGRQKACEAKQASLEKRLANYTRHSEKHLATFDKIYDRVQDFQETKKLDAASYDELIAVANEKHEAAEAAVAALKEVSTSIDCSSEDPANGVAVVKTAVADTRTALKEYRTSIKDVIRSLNASLSKDSDDSSTSESSDEKEETDSTSDDATTDGGTN